MWSCTMTTRTRLHEATPQARPKTGTRASRPCCHGRISDKLKYWSDGLEEGCQKNDHRNERNVTPIALLSWSSAPKNVTRFLVLTPTVWPGHLAETHTDLCRWSLHNRVSKIQRTKDELMRPEFYPEHRTTLFGRDPAWAWSIDPEVEILSVQPSGKAPEIMPQTLFGDFHVNCTSCWQNWSHVKISETRTHLSKLTIKYRSIWKISCYEEFF